MSWVDLGKGEGRKGGVERVGGCKEGIPGGGHLVQPGWGVEGGKEGGRRRCVASSLA